MIVFKVEPYTFCAPAVEVERIITMPPLTRLPKTPPSIIGVVNHRGRVYRVISLRRKLGLESGPPLLRGQLILTRLSGGNCAFLVDEVIDILPGTYLVRHSLKPHSPMELFDAFVLHGEQVLFQTRFEMIEQAGETPFPSPDLEFLHRMAADVPAQPAPLQGSTETEDSGYAADDMPTEQAAMPPANDHAAPSTASHGPKDMIPKPSASAAAPRKRWKAPRLPRSPAGEMRSRPRARAAIQRNRIRRLAWALTAVSMLVLVAALSSNLLPPAGRLWLQQPHPGEGGREQPPKFFTATAKTAETSPTPGGLPADNTIHSDAPPVKPSAKPAETPSASASNRTASTGNDASQRHRLNRSEEKIEAEGRPEPPVPSEVLRLETGTFTLTVERPATAFGNEDSLSENTENSTIVHRVVSGDTLWDIADHYLGDPFQYPELAHLSEIRNPDLIYPGDVIRIVRKPL